MGTETIHAMVRRRWGRPGDVVELVEIPKPQRNDYNFNLHFRADNQQNGVHVPGDLTEWHNYAVEWTADHVAGFVDGQEVFRTTEKEPDLVQVMVNRLLVEAAYELANGFEVECARIHLRRLGVLEHDYGILAE